MRHRISHLATALAAAFAMTFVAGAPVAHGQKKQAKPAAAKPADAQPAEGSAAAAEAEPARTIALRDALVVGARQNRTLQIANIDVSISNANIQASRGVDDWTLDAGLNWRTARNDAIAGLPYQTLSDDRLSLDAAISRNLPDGGRLGVRLLGSYDRQISLQQFSQAGMPALVNELTAIYYAPSLQLEYTQPLLRGFGSDVARAERRRAEANKSVSVLEREVTAANVIRDLVQQYWELTYALEEREIREQSLALAREQLRVTKAGIEVGKLAPTESASVEAQIATREEDVLLAQQNVDEQALQLRLLAGMEIGPGEISLEPTDRPNPSFEQPDLDRSLADAMARNPQLKAIAGRGTTALIEVEVAENGLLPALDFTATAGPQAQSDGVGPAFENLVTFDSYSIEAGLRYSQDFGKNGAKGRSAAARGQYQRVKMSEADLRAQISVQVVRAADLVRSATKRIEVLAKSTDLAKINIQSERARFDVGRATNFDLLRRQDELAQAQLRQARALIDYLRAIATLEALTGDILGSYGVVVQN